MKMALAKDHYIAPLKYNWPTSFYDPLLRWTLREETFKRQLVQQANIAPGHRDTSIQDKRWNIPDRR